MRIVRDECIVGGKTVVKGICTMNVTKISKVSFTGKIIDSHAHVGGHCGEVYRKNDLDGFVKSKLPNDDTVEKMIVSSLDVLHGANGEIDGNKAVLRDFAENGKYALLASCNPRAGNVGNIKKLFSEHPESFAGLKFHPAIQDLRLQDRRYEPYMQFASENGLPCLFHTQVELLDGGKLNLAKTHVADPENIYFLARKYPQTPVVMAHLGAGWREAHDKAADVLISSIRNGDANLYADVSWVDIDDAQTHIVKTIKRLKGIGERDWSFGDQSFRLMFGTDAPLGRFKSENAAKTYADYVERIKAAIRADVDLKPNAEKIIDDLFYNNAERLYLSRLGGISGNKKGTSFAGTELENAKNTDFEGSSRGKIAKRSDNGGFAAENISGNTNASGEVKLRGEEISGISDGGKPYDTASLHGETSSESASNGVKPYKTDGLHGKNLSSGSTAPDVSKGAGNVSSDTKGVKPRKTGGSSPSGSTPNKGKIAAIILGISAVAGAIFIYRKIKANKASR